jgi:hypothetical protein
MTLLHAASAFPVMSLSLRTVLSSFPHPPLVPVPRLPRLMFSSSLSLHYHHRFCHHHLLGLHQSHHPPQSLPHLRRLLEGCLPLPSSLRLLFSITTLVVLRLPHRCPRFLARVLWMIRLPDAILFEIDIHRIALVLPPSHLTSLLFQPPPAVLQSPVPTARLFRFLSGRLPCLTS